MEIQSTGATTLVDYLKTLSFSGGAGTIGSNFTNGGNGTTQIALRGIGGENTLVLLNGRRMAPSGTGSTIDLNAIPFSMVEKIEVLKSGGSVVYGTDAVAGVINVILKKKAAGGTASLYYGNTTATDAANRVGSFSVGAVGNKFSFIVGASWQKENGQYAPDRRYAMGGGNSTYGNPGRFFFSGPAQAALLAANGVTSGGSWTLDAGKNVATTPADFKVWNNAFPENGGDRFPYERFTTMINPNKRYNVYLNYEYEIFDQRLRMFGDINYADTHSEFQLAASPFSAAIPIPATNYWVQQIFGPVTNSVGLLYRFADFNPRLNVVDRSVFRLVTGFRGDLTDTISYETSWNYSEETTSDKELNGVSQARLVAASGTNTPADYNFFTRSYTPQDGTVPAGSPFNNRALLASLRVDNNTAVSSAIQVFDFKLKSSELFALPAGPIEATVGLEMRKQAVLGKPDDAKLSGSIGWNAASGITKGDRRVLGGYFEAGIPILPTLSGVISYRYEQYRDEFNARVGGIGLRWRAIKDELTFRGNFSQGFVAPALLDVFNPGFESFPEIIDSRFAATDPNRIYQISVSYVGSKAGGQALLPEESNIYSFGFTYSPKAIKGLEMTVDWAKIEQKNLIVYSVQGVVSEWIRTGGPAPTAAFADRIILRPDSTAPNGVVIDSLLNVGPRNVALQTTEYVDATLAYTLPTDRFGRWVFGADATYYLSQVSTSQVGGTPFSYGGIFNGDVVYPQWKGRLKTRWSDGPYTAALTGNYMGGGINESGSSAGNIEQDWTLDVQFGYKLPVGRDRFGTTLTVGARNVLNNPPPTNPGSFSNNYPERSYDPRGRFLYVKLDQKF